MILGGALPHFARERAVSAFASRVDQSLAFAMQMSALLFILFLIALALVWLWPSRVRHETPATAPADVTWGLVPWGVAMIGVAGAYFWLGLVPCLDGAVAPDNAIEIHATSSKGIWLFEYPNGKMANGSLVVPRGQAVRVRLSSTDVPHELYLPRFRVRQTALPGQYTSVWFRPMASVETHIECTVFCPAGARAVPATVSVVEPTRFDEWLSAPNIPQKVSRTEGTK